VGGAANICTEHDTRKKNRRKNEVEILNSWYKSQLNSNTHAAWKQDTVQMRQKRKNCKNKSNAGLSETFFFFFALFILAPHVPSVAILANQRPLVAGAYQSIGP
jgi:hypothetical protein